jgi:23S rRNA (adenine2030-N6)-methyltransferase
MLSYRHAFHAGNYADVVKHLTLSLILQALSRKESPFCYVDSHAGAAVYNLNSGFAQKTGEFKEGIELLWQLAKTQLPPLVKPYLAALRAVNPGNQLNTYLGSPALAQYFSRPQDRLTLMELHPSDYHILKAHFKNDTRIHVHQRDGFEGLIALTPPLQKRGLMDPAYELKQDYLTVFETLKNAHKRWQTGVYALWYPLLNEQSYQQTLLKRLKNSGIKKILLTELTRYPSQTPRAMYGTGMVIINPPYQLEQMLHEVMPWLWQLLTVQGEGDWKVAWLVPE